MKRDKDLLRMKFFAGRLSVAIVVVAFGMGWAANARGQTSAVVPSDDANAILMRMAAYLAKSQSFSVDVRDSYDAYQESGQKIEFNESRKILVVRPDHLRIDVEESDGDESVILFDGKLITMSTPSKNVYAQTARPGNLDNAIVYFVRDLGMRLPFAPLLLSAAPAEIAKRTKSLDYVETTRIFGAPAHHLAARTDSVDYQIWISDGDRPLPLRLVLTYPTAEGQPQFRAQFSNWNFAPDLTASSFAFTPPLEAQKIAFAAEIPQSAVIPEAIPAEPVPSKESGGPP